MLGITVSDATLVGAMLLSFLAFWNGNRSGASAARNKDPGPVLSLGGGAFVDTLGLHDNTAALNRVADAIEKICDRIDGQHDHRIMSLLEQIASDRKAG
jgi:hypothetical protein